MELAEALHTAARRFCADQHYRWTREYEPLLRAGTDRVGMGYSIGAYRLFPRYRLDEAILTEVERLTGSQFQSTEEVRKLLLEAANRATSSLLREFQRSNEACDALKDESRTFEMYVVGLDLHELSSVEPLPYRRVL